MKNKLTLKALKQELDLIKARSIKVDKSNSSKDPNVVGQDVKNSYINNLHMRSTMLYLWLLSWVIFFIHKIPFIGRISTLLSLYYGRTTVWRILFKIRKAFVIFNALIGVYMVYKTTGFGLDNLLAGF